MKKIIISTLLICIIGLVSQAYSSDLAPDALFGASLQSDPLYYVSTNQLFWTMTDAQQDFYKKSANDKLKNSKNIMVDGKLKKTANPARVLKKPAGNVALDPAAEKDLKKGTKAGNQDATVKTIKDSGVLQKTGLKLVDSSGKTVAE
ncbi:hypothetical protein HOB95_00125 [bacterium]|nr:hypothetical protein [bacterium]